MFSDFLTSQVDVFSFPEIQDVRLPGTQDYKLTVAFSEPGYGQRMHARKVTPEQSNMLL